MGKAMKAVKGYVLVDRDDDETSTLGAVVAYRYRKDAVERKAFYERIVPVVILSREDYQRLTEGSHD